MEHVALDLHRARLGLSEPVRKQRHEQGMRLLNAAEYPMPQSQKATAVA